MHNFKKAIQTTVLFLLMFGMLSIGIMELYFSGEDHYYQDVDARNELAGTIDYAVIGASHAERGINVAIIDEKLGVNSYNFSGPDFLIWGRYDLLKKELARNPIKTVIMEVSLETLKARKEGMETEGDLYYMGRLETPAERISYFTEHFPVSEYITSYQFFMSYGVESLKRIFQGKYMWTYNWPYRYKGYKMYEGGGANDVSIDYAKKFKVRHVDNTLLDEKIEYLDKIVQLCEEQGVELILINTPVSKTQIARKDGYDFMYSWYSKYAEEHDLAFYDFNLLKNRDELFTDQDSFRDVDHLWNEGADILTSTMCDILTQAAKGEDVSGLFFESYDAYERTQDYYPQ